MKINGLEIKELVIDTHYEINHSSYMNDEKIYQIFQPLLKKRE
jgi:hypothetical protein